ncbi:MAG: helix-turn-helix domain-containing protein [Phycisphaerales bacterium]|nr:helix-turn-helix domain-containing protein [Phycisphaerales bacterium]
MEEVVQKIKNVRKQKGFSHENMALELGISQAAYTKIENNETKLSVDRLFQISKILNTPVYELLNVNPNTVFNQHNHEGGTGYQQQIDNLHQHNKELQDAFIKQLKDEIVFLKELLNKSVQ